MGESDRRMTIVGDEPSADFLDLNGKQVHAFAQRMANIGYAELADLLRSMLDSGVWRRFTTGLGEHVFLPGEFDYFLTQQGVQRDDVMVGVRDMDMKAEIEAAMDERRTGEEGYRRRLAEVRQQIPVHPGRSIEPFGHTVAEVKSLVRSGVALRDTGQRVRHREALGAEVRRFTNTDGRTSVRPSREPVPRWMYLRNSAERLGSEDLDQLVEALRTEQRRRRRQSS